MTEKHLYRLNEFRITDYETRVLWWETHHGLGMQRKGKCFIYHDILIIGHPKHEEPGYLKKEFLDQLEKLPPWNKTKYFCFASELLDVVSGRSVDEDFLDRICHSVSPGTNQAKAGVDEGQGTFRLNKYQITVAANHQISWQSYPGNMRVVGGRGIIQSGVLFVGPQEYDKEEQTENRFLDKLHKLPRWDKTKIWSRHLALRTCQPQLEKEWPSASTVRPEKRGGRLFHGKLLPPSWQQGRPLGRLLKLEFNFQKPKLPRCRLPLGFIFRKSAWHRCFGEKARLIYLIPLLVAGLLFGVMILAYHWVEERLEGISSPEKHHHKHKDRGR